MARVVYGQEFYKDVARVVAYLADRQELAWIETLAQDLDEIEGLLGRFPEAGHELTREGTSALRKLRLRRAPFYVWYAFDAGTAGAPVWFVRLFHVRQAGPLERP